MTRGASFLARAPRTGRLLTGQGVVELEKCDVTVSRLASGEYRCFKCPSMPGGHWLSPDAGEALLHAVDHLAAGLAVPAEGLKKLAGEALRDA